MFIKGSGRLSCERFIKGAWVVVLIVLAAAIVTLSWVPPVSRDALTHHLAIPKLFLKHGGIYEIPHVVFSYYPMNVELLYLIPLFFGNDILPKLIHFSFALLTTGLIFSYLSKRTNWYYAFFGAVFFLSIPIIVKLSITVYVDLGLAFFSTAALIQIFKWMETRFSVKHLVMAGVWCGLALGTKYNGLVCFVLLALFIPFIYLRNRQGQPFAQTRAVGYCFFFMAVALLVFSPWMIRNYVYKRNPIYPLYHHLFSAWTKPPAPIVSGEDIDKTQAKQKTHTFRPQGRLGLFAYRQIVYHESWFQIASVPIRIFFSGQDDEPRHFDGKLTPFLFLLPLLAFVFPSQKGIIPEEEKWVLLLFSLLFILIAFFSIEMRIRYILPIVPPLVMLSMLGVYRLNRLVLNRYPAAADKALVIISCVVAVPVLIIHAGYIMEQFRIVRPLDYLSGKVGREAYIERYRKEYPVLQYANKNLGENDRILGVFLGNRIYYSDRTLLTDTEAFFNAVKNVQSSEKLWNDIKKEGLTHIIIRTDLFETWVHDNLSAEQQTLIQNFFNHHLRLLYFKNGYGLFKLED